MTWEPRRESHQWVTYWLNIGSACWVWSIFCRHCSNSYFERATFRNPKAFLSQFFPGNETTMELYWNHMAKLAAYIGIPWIQVSSALALWPMNVLLYYICNLGMPRPLLSTCMIDKCVNSIAKHSTHSHTSTYMQMTILTAIYTCTWVAMLQARVSRHKELGVAHTY